MKKYELTDIYHPVYPQLRRIRALKEVVGLHGVRVDVGDLGGWVESTRNLSQQGSCWIEHEAMVRGEAAVIDEALVSDFAVVYGRAILAEYAWVSDTAHIYGNAVIKGYCWVFGRCKIHGEAVLADKSKVFDKAEVCGDTLLLGKTFVAMDAIVDGGTHIDATIRGGWNV